MIGGISLNRSEYNRKYHQEHREEILERQRKRYNDNIEQERERKRIYREENLDEVTIYQEMYRKGKRNKIDKIFGTTCILCKKERGNKGQGFALHEIYGKKHPISITYEYYFKHQNDFVLLCISCHMFIHEIVRRIKK